MTNKEAINLLDNLLGMVEDNQNSDYDTALKMAIETLKQPELPIKEKCTVCPHCDNCDVNDDGTIAQPERKKGMWKKGGEQPYFRKHFDIVVCSICNKRGEHRWNFCPNCGADMRERRTDGVDC